MFPYLFRPNNPKPERPSSQPTTIKGLFNDFLTKPIPLPIWLWNILVIAIYVRVIVYILQFAAIVVVGALSLFFG